MLDNKSDRITIFYHQLKQDVRLYTRGASTSPLLSAGSETYTPEHLFVSVSVSAQSLLCYLMKKKGIQ